MHFRPKPFDRYPGIPMPSRTMARELIQHVSAWHGVNANLLTGPRRTNELAAARFDAIAAIYLNCRRGGCRLSLNEIGRIVNRERTTVWHALKVRGLR